MYGKQTDLLQLGTKHSVFVEPAIHAFLLQQYQAQVEASFLAADECILVTAFPEAEIIYGKQDIFLLIGLYKTKLHFRPETETVMAFVLPRDPWVSGITSWDASYKLQNLISKDQPLLKQAWYSRISSLHYPRKFNESVCAFQTSPRQRAYLVYRRWERAVQAGEQSFIAKFSQEFNWEGFEAAGDYDMSTPTFAGNYMSVWLYFLLLTNIKPFL